MRPDGTVILDGTEYQLISYGAEFGAFKGPCHICHADLGTLHALSCPLGPGQLYQRPAKCRDCGVSIGEVHMLNCGIESCPRCGGQYVSCACNGSEDRPDAPDDFEANRRAARATQAWL